VDSQEVTQLLDTRPADRRSRARYLPLVLDGLRITLFLLVIINVSRIHQSVKMIGAMRPGLLVVLVAGVFAVLNPRKANRRDLFKTTEAKLILALFIVACLSAVAGISLGNSVKFIIERYSKVVIASFLLLAGIRHARDLYTLMWAYVIGSGTLAYMAIFMFKVTKRFGSNVARLQELYTFDSNDIGVVLMVGIPIALLLARHTSGIRKWFCFLVVAAIGVAMARSGSRGTLVGLVGTGGVLLMALKTVPLWKRVTFVGVIGIALVAAAPPGYWEQMQTILGLKEDYNWTSKDGRRQLLFRGLGYMAHYPLTGLGIDNFGRAECLSTLSEKVLTHVRGTGLKCSAPHNTYLQVGAETGLSGLTIWLMLIFGGIKRLRVMRRRLPKAWRAGDAEQRFMYDATLYLPIALVGFAITTVFVTFAWLDIAYIAIAYQAGLTIAVRKRLAQDLATQSVPVARAPAPAPIGVALPAT
jgi:O-antigen ligase